MSSARVGFSLVIEAKGLEAIREEPRIPRSEPCGLRVRVFLGLGVMYLTTSTVGTGPWSLWLCVFHDRKTTLPVLPVSLTEEGFCVSVPWLRCGDLTWRNRNPTLTEPF